MSSRNSNFTPRPVKQLTETQIVEIRDAVNHNYTGDMPGKCNNRLWHCRICDYHYNYDDPQERDILECPNCSEPREYCRANPIAGREKCAVHGGKAPRGIAASNYKGAGISKHLPTRMMEAYELAYTSGDLVDLSDSLALLRARRIDLLNRMEEYVSEDLWKAAVDAYNKFDKARASGSANRMNAALFELSAVLGKGSQSTDLWREILRVEEQLRRTTSTELQRRKLAHTVITEEEFKTLLGYIMHSINKHVQDPATKNNLILELQKLYTN